MSLRTAMPETAALIDELRLAFGVESINASIRLGLTGQPTFYAREAGREVGTALPACTKTCSADDWLAATRYITVCGHTAKRGRA